MSGILDDLSDMFPDEVSVEPLTGEDRYGKKTYGTAVVYRAFVFGRIRKVMTMEGQEKVSSVTAVIASSAILDVKSRYTLPVRFTPRVPVVLAVDNSTDESGAHHSTVYF